MLERMQEKVWAYEEEGEGECDDIDGRTPRVRRDSETPEEEDAGPNLLYQVLAMILGALPKGSLGMTTTLGKEEKTSDEEHYRRAKEEHNTIAHGWMKAFERLPPFPSVEGP